MVGAGTERCDVDERQCGTGHHGSPRPDSTAAHAGVPEVPWPDAAANVCRQIVGAAVRARREQLLRHL